jgi:hypothetical protein
MLVRKDLYLDMPRRRNVFLNEHFVVPKRVSPLTLCTLQLVQEFIFIQGNSHALPTSPLDGLNHHRESDLLRFLQQVFRFLIRPMITRYTRHTSLNHNILTPRFIPHSLNRFPRWPNKHQPLLHTTSRKRRILAQEPIPRM